MTMPLHIPDLPEDATNLEAALAYAKAGLYVLPVRRNDPKNPGSVVGEGWQHGKSTIDPQQIAALFAGTDYGIAIDLGRSGLFALDVDRAEMLAGWLATALTESGAPYQSTRVDTPGRGHYLFRQPLDRQIGNSKGRLAGLGLDVRGNGGVIIAQGSIHELADEGGQYRWVRTGLIPFPSSEIADKLPDAQAADIAATPAEVDEFISNHTESAVPTVMSAWRKIWNDHMDSHDSRHTSAVTVIVGALKEAAAGVFSAKEFLDWFEPVFIAAKTRPPIGGEKRLTEAQARKVLWDRGGIIPWSVAQARTADVAETLARTYSKTPSPRLAEHMVARGLDDPRPESERTMEPEPFDTGAPEYQQVRGALRKKTTNAYGDMLRICGACVRAGLTEAQMLFVLQERDDLKDVGHQKAWENAVTNARRASEPIYLDGDGAAERRHLLLTDSLNAELFIEAYRDNIHWVPERGSKGLITWTGTHWQHEADDGPAIYAAKTMIQAQPVTDEGALDFKERSLQRRGLQDMVSLAKTSPDMRVRQADMDADPYALNTPDGVIDLKTGGLRPHNPREWHSRITGCGYNPTATDADCPKWIAFLNTTFQGKSDMIAYIQRLLGYIAVGEVTEHILAFLWGPGGFNGKTALANLLLNLLGSYAKVASGNFLLEGHAPHTEEIASMNGARLIVCSEVNQDSKFDEQRSKHFTGGDDLEGRHLYGTTFDFKPSHTLLVLGNERPGVAVGGNSFFRRFHLIPFLHQVPEKDRVLKYEDVLLAEEGPAIMAWIVRGAVDMIGKGIRTPAEVTAATKEFQDSEDVVGQFLSDCTMRRSRDYYVTSSDLYARYEAWCKENGEKAKASNRFGSDVIGRGYEKDRANQRRVVRGISLLAETPAYTAPAT